MAFEDIAIAFFPEILGMDYVRSIWITDESSLRDFAGCGAKCADYPAEINERSLDRPTRVKLWCRWVSQTVFARYSIAIPETARRTFANVNSSPTTARQPDVPNLSCCAIHSP